MSAELVLTATEDETGVAMHLRALANLTTTDLEKSTILELARTIDTQLAKYRQPKRREYTATISVHIDNTNENKE